MCQFFSRTVIIQIMSLDYAGLSGLFSNILTMLSLAELGVGEAIIFSLYGPIARTETDTIKSIMTFYQKVYRFVGAFIFAAGVAVTPFIYSLIKDPPDIPHLRFIYVLYVINSAMSYFFSYKASYVTATQNNYIVVRNNGIFEIARVACQAAVLLVFRSYVGFMITGIAFVLLQNISITVIADRMFPYLRERGDRIPGGIFEEIKKNTAAMVFHKIGTIVVFATDNLIISKMIGLGAVAIYTNYTLITSAVTVFIAKFFNAIAASVGNLAVEESIEKQESAFKRIFFINFWLYTFSCTCLLVLLNPFIGYIWLRRESLLFSTQIVLIIVVKTYFTGMRSAAQTFKNAKGLYWYNRYMPIYESLINLVVSIALAIPFGVAGVLIGTIVSTVTTCAWIEPHVLYKYGFKKSASWYYRQYIGYLCIFAVVMAVTYGAASIAGGKGISAFVIRFLISIVVPNVMLLAIYGRSDNFRFMKNILVKRMLRRGGRG